MRSIVSLFLLLCLSASSFGQVKGGKLEELNTAIEFANESDHGLLIVHRLLEIYNQEINKYVDLESFKINDFSNDQLPKQIFLDEENWFYDTSPFEWYDIGQTTIQNSEIKTTMTEMRSYLVRINQIRFDVEALIKNEDLTDTATLNKVYAQLENGVDYYDTFYNLHKKLEIQINTEYKRSGLSIRPVEFPSFYKSMQDLYNATKNVLLAVRNKEDENFPALIAAHKKALEVFNQQNLGRFNSTRMTSRKMSRLKTKIIEQSEQALASAMRFFETAEVIEEYKQYGKFYYYYNQDIINKYNRYGNGIVEEMNNIIEYLDLDVILFSELPHYYKVIYPKKLERVEHLAATDSKITALPTRLKERKIQMSTRTIKVDSAYIEVSLYDHMIVDGDIVSLNFNGDWIVEKMALTAKKKILKLQLNEIGKNYFILHAESVGRRPPNTMAVDYFYRGKKQQIILKSDLNVSELIEIEID